MLFLLGLIFLQQSHQVYLVKNYWHTGIMFSVNEELISHIPAISNFAEYKFVDIGWGDEAFYQHPDPDYLLGAQAILVPTSSVIRMEGKNSSLNNIIEWSDFSIRFDLSNEQFLKLCKYIENSFEKDEHQNLFITSTKSSGRITFYKSHKKYHLFNTCNTWVAEALEESGFDISSSNVITAENLFEEVSKFGTVLKEEIIEE